MKFSTLRKSPIWLFAGLLVLAGLIGCEDDEGIVDAEGESFPISVTHIIVNPKSPAPGDTIQLTVVIESDSVTMGDFPTIEWSASGGSFLESDEVSVRWVAPTTSQLYSIAVRVTNSVNSSSFDATLFVGTTTERVASEAGRVILKPSGTDFFYLRSPLIAAGVELYDYDGGDPSDVISDVQLGSEFVMAQDQSYAAYQAMNQAGATNIRLVDVGARTEAEITTDTSDPTGPERDHYTGPYFTPDGALLVFQALVPGATADDRDQTDVAVHDIGGGTTEFVTATHGTVRNNFFPTISSDGNWLVFVSDRSSRSTWELNGLRINGMTVDTDSSDTVQFTSTNGQVASGTVLTITRPLMVWNPDPSTPVMAIRLSTGAVALVEATPSGGQLTQVTGLTGNVQQMVWSDDGTTLALANGRSVFTVPSSGGQATLRHTAPEGDALFDVTWSPTKDFLFYRIVRGLGSWHEIVDIGAGQLEDPVVLTKTFRSGELGTYRQVMSMSAAYGAGDVLFFPVFVGSSMTPSIYSVNIAGALQ